MTKEPNLSKEKNDRSKRFSIAIMSIVLRELGL